MEANLIILPKHTEKNTLDMGFKNRVKKTFEELYENVTDDEITVCQRKHPTDIEQLVDVYSR